MALRHPFETSYGKMQDKEFLVIEVVDRDGISGWGESVAFTAPWYTEETVKTTEHMLYDFLIPLLGQAPILHPDDLIERFSVVKRNNMAKASIEGAIWDVFAKKQGISLASALGGVKQSIDVGVSIGIQKSIDDLLEVISQKLAEGYKRIKIKIKPGYDINVVHQVRQAYPDVPLMVDANSAYTLEDTEHLKQLDAYHLMMIEQPLAHDDMIQHAKLQREIKTPICLDESITSFDDARNAIALGSCKVINIKPGRVGGLSQALRIHHLCKEKDIPVWCGGMLEAGIGRAQLIALTSLEQFLLPGDTSGSSHYWEKDIIKPEVMVKDGCIQVPDGLGIGYKIDFDALDQFTISENIFTL